MYRMKPVNKHTASAEDMTVFSRLTYNQKDLRY